MKRVALAAVLLCGGCSQPKTEVKSEQKAAPVYFQVDPSTAVTVKGQVRFKGKAPAAKRISMDAEEACQGLHKTPVFEEKVLVDKKGGLANVFVYIKGGFEGKTFAPAPQSVVLEQRGCQFIPRVVALRTGQTLTVRNSDPVSHNVHPMPKNNRDWNQQQAPQAEDLKRRFGFAEVMIPVKCNIHAWMKSYIGVLDHPFYAVSDGGGAFTIDGLPAGEYVLAGWHETLGEVTQRIAVKKGDDAPAEIVFQ